MILVGDVGGTNTRLALARRSAHGWEFPHTEVLATPEDLGRLVGAYLRKAGTTAVQAAGLCAAGPLRPDGSISLTNARCEVDPARLSAAIGGAPAIVLNDFAAVAHALRGLRDEDLRRCGGGEPVTGAPRLVVGAGTGLGVASVAGDPHATVLPGEGGHASLAPADAEEAAAWSSLYAQSGRVSAETVLSGPGLERLYRLHAPDSPLRAAQIAQSAWDGQPDAVRTVHLFTRWLGHFCGSLALTIGASGGVYIAGGIVPGWDEHFDAAAFRAAFEDHEPFAHWLRGIPAFVVRHPFPGLLGMALVAESALQQAA
jgi:glucokinase